MKILTSKSVWGMLFLIQGCTHQSAEIKALEKQHEARFTAAMEETLAQLYKNKTKGENDPDKIKAMQVLAKTDAAKSYAFTQIYAVAAKYCGTEVNAVLIRYQNEAAAIIKLGQYYYQHGIYAKIADRDLSQSGEALTAGLLEMTDKLEQEHQMADDQQLQKKCNEAKQALGSLTYLYGN